MSKFNLLTTLSLNASGLSDGLKKSIKDVENYVNEAKGKNSILNTSFRDVAQMGIGEMKKELVSLSKISFAGKTPEEIQIIKQRMGELKDTTGDLRAELAVLGGPGIGAVIGGFEFLSAGVEGTSAVLSVLGVDTDVVKKLESKMTSLIAVTHALGVAEDYVNSGKLRAIGLKLKDMTATVSNTIAVKAATIAQLNLNTAMSASLYGAAALAVVGLVAGIVYLVNAENDATEAAQRHYEEIKKLNDRSIERKRILDETAEDAVKSFSKQQIHIDHLVRSIDNEKTSLTEKKKALKELIALDPDYLKGLTLQNIAAEDGKKLIDLYIGALKKKAIAEAAASQLSELYLKQFKIEQKIREALIGQEVLAVQKASIEKRMAMTSDFGLSQELGKSYAEINKKLEQQAVLIGDLDTIGTGSLFDDLKNSGDEIDRMSSLLDKNTVAVEFNTSANNSNADSLKKIADANKVIFDSWKDAPYFEYNIPTMTSIGLPQPEKMKLAGDEGDTVPGFNYDELTAGADAFNERLEKSRELAGLATDSFLMLGDAIGTAAAGGEASFQSMVVSMLGGIRQVIAGMLAEAIAAMIAGEAPKGLPGLILAGIGISAITAMFASLPKFEYGGIAPGNSFSGDQVLARVNSKEMILTQRQQAQLFDLANGSGAGGGMADVRFRIEGDALVGVLNRYNKRVKSYS